MNARKARRLRKLYPHPEGRHRDYLYDPKTGQVVCADRNRQLYQQAKKAAAKSGRHGYPSG